MGAATWLSQRHVMSSSATFPVGFTEASPAPLHGHLEAGGLFFLRMSLPHPLIQPLPNSAGFVPLISPASALLFTSWTSFPPASQDLSCGPSPVSSSPLAPHGHLTFQPESSTCGKLVMHVCVRVCMCERVGECGWVRVTPGTCAHCTVYSENEPFRPQLAPRPTCGEAPLKAPLWQIPYPLKNILARLFLDLSTSDIVHIHPPMDGED